MIVKDWNIEGIAESVIDDLKNDLETSDEHTNIQELWEDQADYYLQTVFHSIESRDVKNAALVRELVKKHVDELFEK